jgi:hypothetical protein
LELPEDAFAKRERFHVGFVTREGRGLRRKFGQRPGGLLKNVSASSSSPSSSALLEKKMKVEKKKKVQ